jgi:signal recognition particle GTPase
LTATLGEGVAELNLRHQPPAVILLAGLQGAGKTTTAAKLAVFIRDRLGKRAGLASTDTQRPAAMLQLERLAASIDIPWLGAAPGLGPLAIADQALKAARLAQLDVLILDTAGRSRLDSELLDEVREMSQRTDPIETLFVVDSMAGQDAVNAARAFAAVLPLTGVILTKTDGDARGGAALSVKAVTGVPIKFLGTGEAVAELEPFHPDRMASRILGMGDVLGLVEEVQRKADHAAAAQLAEKISTGKQFDLNDLRAQLEQISGLGGVESMLDKLPLPAGMSAEKLAGAGRPPYAASPDRDHQLDDSPGAPPTRNHRWIAPQAHSRRFRPAGAGGQPAAEAAHPDAENDEKDGAGWFAAHDAGITPLWPVAKPSRTVLIAEFSSNIPGLHVPGIQI